MQALAGGGTKWKEDMLAPGQGEGSEPCPLSPERGCGYRTGQRFLGWRAAALCLPAETRFSLRQLVDGRGLQGPSSQSSRTTIVQAQLGPHEPGRTSIFEQGRHF